MKAVNMDAVDLRPTKELTRLELVRKVYQLQDKIQVLTEQLANVPNTPKRGHYKPRVKFMVSENTRALEWRVYNLEKRLQKYEPFDVTERMETILTFVSEMMGMPKEHIKCKLQSRPYLKARAAFYYGCKLCGISYPKMAAFLNKNHRSVINGRQQALKYLSQEQLESLDNFINNL